MPRLPDHEIIASLQAQVISLRIQLRAADAVIQAVAPAGVKESLTTEMKANADAVGNEMDALRARVAELEAVLGESRHALVMCQANSEEGSRLRSVALARIDSLNP